MLRYRLNENSYYGTSYGCQHGSTQTDRKTTASKGYLNQTDDEYGLLKLTENSYDITVKGEQVMLEAAKGAGKGGGRAQSAVKTSDRYPKKGRHPAIRSFMEILRNLRNETARNMHVPAYVVFADKTLQEMSTYLPVTREERCWRSVVWHRQNYEKYGELFIEVIREYKAGHEETHKLPTARARIRF